MVLLQQGTEEKELVSRERIETRRREGAKKASSAAAWLSIESERCTLIAEMAKG